MDAGGVVSFEHGIVACHKILSFSSRQCDSNVFEGNIKGSRGHKVRKDVAVVMGGDEYNNQLKTGLRWQRETTLPLAG